MVSKPGLDSPSPDPRGGGLGHLGFLEQGKGKEISSRPGPRSHYARGDRVSPVPAP